MIVQELRKIQERLGWLPKEEMRALAQQLNVPLHRVHEVASFYPLYRLSPPPVVDVKVCRDMACHLRGADRMIEALKGHGLMAYQVAVGLQLVFLLIGLALVLKVKVPPREAAPEAAG